MKKIRLSLVTALFLVTAGLFACGGSEEMKLVKDIPKEITCGSEIYFREYINLDYNAEYELYATYTDQTRNVKVENKLLDSLLVKFENVSDYDFTLKKTGGNSIDFSIKCVPVFPKLKESVVYKVARGTTEPIEDLIFWCGLELKDEEAKLDPVFRWEFSKVEIKSASVNGVDREESLLGLTDYTFSDEAEYVISVKAINSIGEDETQIVVSTMDSDRHSDEVSGYVFEDDNKIEFDISTIKGFNLPQDGQVIKTRINDAKYDAIYDEETDRFTISGVETAFSTGSSYRLFLSDTEDTAFSISIVVPDLVLSESNFKELELFTKGVVILSQSINMKNVVNYGSGRVGKNYGDYWFKGTFDGRGYTIENYNTYNMSFAGSLLWSADGATIKNVIFKNATVSGNNSVVTGRTTGFTAFKNVAVEVVSMNMTQSGAISGPGEFGSSYDNCIIYVGKNSVSDITKSGFVNGLYCRSAEFNNVYLVSETKLPVAPSGHAGIVPALGGDYKLWTLAEAKEKVLAEYDWGTELLSSAASEFFSEGEVIHLTKNNIEKELLIPSSGYYVLDEDIDMSEFTAWGSGRIGEYKDYYFTGTLDGNGHTISNFKVTIGSFRGGLLWSMNGATVKNLIFKNAEITVGNAGLITGRMDVSKGVIENVFAEISVMQGAGNGLIAPMNVYQPTCEYKNVAVYVKEVNGTITNSAAIAGVYSYGLRVTGLYFITDTTLPLAPAHASVTTVIKNIDGTADAVSGTDYFVLSVAEAKEKVLAEYDWGTELIGSTATEIFSEKPIVDERIHVTKDNIEELLLLPSDGYYVLDEDIDMSGFTSWGSGRTGEYKDHYFTGTLDGNGHTINNFKVTIGSFRGGLLWSINGATVKNLVFKNAEISVANAGLITGRMDGKKSVIENVFAEISVMQGAGNGLIAPMNVYQPTCEYNSVAVYVKEVNGDITNSAAIAGVYSYGLRVSDFYFITDTKLPLAPAHASVITAIKNSDGTADAVSGTDYFVLTVAEAKERITASYNWGTELLSVAATEIFSTK